jgi:hypothetical protein
MNQKRTTQKTKECDFFAKVTLRHTAETRRTETSLQEVEVKGFIDLRILGNHVGCDE